MHPYWTCKKWNDANIYSCSTNKINLYY